MIVYDYIFCGMGLSALLTLEALSEKKLLDNKKILILDRQEPLQKTWCFWEKGTGKWDSILRHSWKKGFFTDQKNKKEILGGFTYKCLDSDIFKQHILKKLNNIPGLVFQAETVINWRDDGTIVTVETESQTYQGRVLFNSGFQHPTDFGNHKVLLQHFEGWFIESEQLPFDPEEIWVMDFSVPQKNNTRFVYVLPFSKNTALVEYTLFSADLLEKEEYEHQIRNYLQKHGITDFKIVKKESGIIPMTSFPFWNKNTKNVLHIGTAGGWTKAATGYTFNNASKLSEKLALWLANGKSDFRNFHQTSRFNWYDKLLIEVLYRNNALGKKLFTNLFKRTKPGQVMAFLQQETTILTELKIIWACPTWPFLKALIWPGRKN